MDDRRALIERIAGSVHFSRSARLRDFLLYVGHQSLKEGCPEIHEQEIGARVFGRDSSYDRSQDNIVRVNATELRKRIELYFATEGAHEPLLLEIPRGGYKPVFHKRVPELATVQPHPFPATGTPLPATSIASTFPGFVREHRHNFSRTVLAAVCLLLAIACLLLFQQNRKMQMSLYAWKGKPAVEALWADFLTSHRQTDIVLPDGSLSLIGEIVQRPISLSQYLNHSYLDELQASDISSDRKADLNDIAVHNLVTFGDVAAAQQFLALTPRSSSLHLTLSRYYVADSVKRNNLILIGGKKANPWMGLFDDKMNFSLDYDVKRSQAFVANRHPRAGEQANYMAPMDPNAIVGYSLAAYLPTPGRAGNAIIVAGTDSDATGAAAEFLTSEEQLEQLRKTLHVTKFPYFEVLLKTSRLSGASFGAELIAYRTYPDSP